MSKPHVKNTPLVLCILDGWGIGDGGEYDAIASAHTPCYDALMANYPNTTLTTFGLDVGLPEGQMGNSEVGHMNIGAGRIVMQYLPRIDKAFDSGEVAANKDLLVLIGDLRKSGKRCHIMGLASDGGVHAHIDHILELSSILSDASVAVRIHAFTDGRDCPPESGKGFVELIENHTNANSGAELATITGRYYAMDRDNRWERVEQAYKAIVKGEGKNATSGTQSMQDSYDEGVSDEFIEPVILNDYQGIEDGDAIIFANFRSDRARELLRALLDDDFKSFDRQGGAPKISKAIGLVEYADDLNEKMSVLFPPLEHKNILAEVLQQKGLTQLHMAETEKYPHVTFFFNVGREDPYEDEDRILVDSPKVATYDLQPEMSAPELSDKLLSAVEANKHDVIIVNFANTDMVGHTGSVEAARAAAEAVDGTLCKLQTAVLDKNGVLIVIADHGNADQMYDPETNGPHTAHTLNPVPFIVAGAGDITLKKDGGKLADIAPTMLSLLDVEVPQEMTGEVLVKQ